ncbi:MAG TPA: hypothetical protein DCF48_04220 [Rikenellaceae bacterium]|nr:hypothetical protein [Rikenellaceae bacterium]
MNTTVKRSLSGTVFLAVMLGGLLLGRWPFTILFAFITATMMEEFYRMTMGKSYRRLQSLAVSLAIGLFVVVNFELADGESGITALSCGFIFVIALMVASLFEKDHTDFMKTGFLYAGMLYIGLPLALSNFVVFQEGGTFSGILMIAFFSIIWASDVGAYCFGLLLGQKIWPAKLCPSISPKKSWAGYVGGLATSVLAGAILSWTGLVSFPMVHCLVMAALMHVAGVFGDLFESMWKRSAGIKDSGNIIPGHGGLMDRFDSALFAIPTGYFYLMLFDLV